MLSNRTIGIIKLTLSIGILIYLFFLLLVLPILPIGDTIFELVTPPYFVLLFCGIFGLVFIGSLSVFTLVVLYKHKQEC